MKDKIFQAITEGRALFLRYRGNARVVTPLALGVDKKGREVLICYKVADRHEINAGTPKFVLRIYYLDLVGERLAVGGEIKGCNRKVDAHLTKNLSEVWRHTSEGWQLLGPWDEFEAARKEVQKFNWKQDGGRHHMTISTEYAAELSVLTLWDGFAHWKFTSLDKVGRVHSISGAEKTTQEAKAAAEAAYLEWKEGQQ